MSNDRSTMSIRGNTSHLLLNPNEVWRIETGAVAVFSVRVHDGKPSGRRRYLFSCGAGHLLFGCEPTEANQFRSLLIVGMEDSVGRNLPPEELTSKSTDLDADPYTKVDQWIRNLASVIVADIPLVHAERSEEVGTVDVDEDQVLRPPAQAVRWLNVAKGQVKLADSTQLLLDTESGVVPISDDVWLTAMTASTIGLHETSDIDDPSVYLQGIARLCRLVCTHLDEREKGELANEADRLVDRQRLQDLDTADALNRLVVTLRRPEVVAQETDLLTALAAIGDQLKVTFVPPANSEDMRRVADPVKAIARASRIRTREAALTSQWWLHDCGPLLAYTQEGKQPVALIRKRRCFGFWQYYVILDPKTLKSRRVTEKTNKELLPDAVSFIRPLPVMKKASIIALARFGVGKYWLEACLVIGLAVAVTLLGMLTPVATRLIVDEAIPNANPRLLMEWGLGLVAIAIGSAALQASQGFFLLRLRTGATADLQSGLMDHLFRLRSKFFRRFSSGDLMNRSMMVTEVSREISTTAINGILSGSMAILNLCLCYMYSSKLAWIAVASAAIVAVASVCLSILIRSRAIKLEQLSGDLFGFAVQLVNGVTKLRVAGAEQRAFNRWAVQYSQQLSLINSMQRIQDWGGIINVSMRTASLTVLFFYATKLLGGGGAVSAVPGAMLTMGTFLAFHSAFGTLIGGAVEASNTLVDVMDSWAKRKLMEPILIEKPEVDSGKVDPGRLNGEVTLDELVFRYRDDGPLILDGVSIHATPGDFIALVGPSGCGKSTIFKLLLGFESPESGGVFFDGQDLAGLDMTAVRRQIGVVLQSSYISSGSIFDSIASGNNVTLDEVWTAARDAGFAQDVEEMPMKMHTMLPEGGTTLSGGQKQRLLIARALVLNPKILLFDEATSALDNRTQDIVSRSVERRNVTRVVVAHRLSTIQEADRIYVLDRGQVIESGNYDELVKLGGLFTRMATRQTA